MYGGRDGGCQAISAGEASEAGAKKMMQNSCLSKQARNALKSLHILPIDKCEFCGRLVGGC